MLIDIIQLDFFILQGRLVGFFGWFALKTRKHLYLLDFLARKRNMGKISLALAEPFDD
ncbi:hypothetical protein [Pseudomonas sp. E141]|jgi:hypothetical protein|uniref:hypothetical protein n=1 Tax=Pseudomonas sp. E141 TaxID=2875961 RepID=UPI0040455506